MAWSIELALGWIRDMQPKVMEAGWCLMLGGDVLNRGFGPDLDLLAYPRTIYSKLDHLIPLFPEGQWSHVSVADIYSFRVEGKLIELIVQSMSTNVTVGLRTVRIPAKQITVLTKTVGTTIVDNGDIFDLGFRHADIVAAGEAIITTGGTSITIKHDRTLSG